MSNFKIGEKVVCVGRFYSENPKEEKYANDPKVNEIVTIDKLYYDGDLILKEYKFAKNGVIQSFNPAKFRKLDHQFAEDVCAKLIEEFNTELISN